METATIGPADFRVTAAHCHDRFCSPCATAKSWAVIAELQQLAQGRELRFVTFTLRGADTEDLRARLDRLYASFRDLRRLQIWDANVDGGCAVCEIKRSDRGRWHVHLHCLVEGRFLDQGRLSKAWRGITGDSWVVDVRAVRNPGQATAYVAKYAGKPMDAGFWVKADLLQEAVLALRGRRLVTTFGTWYNPAHDIDQDPLIEYDDGKGAGWTKVGPLAEIFSRAQGGDSAAAAIIAFLRVRDPLTGERPPRPPPGQPADT